MWNPSNPCMHGQRTLNDDDDDDDYDEHLTEKQLSIASTSLLINSVINEVEEIFKILM